MEAQIFIWVKYSIIFVAWSGKSSFAGSCVLNGLFVMPTYQQPLWRQTLIFGDWLDCRIQHAKKGCFIFMSNQCTVNKLAKVWVSCRYCLILNIFPVNCFLFLFFFLSNVCCQVLSETCCWSISVTINEHEFCRALIFDLLCSVWADTCIVRLALYFFINSLKGIVLLMYSHFL